MKKSEATDGFDFKKVFETDVTTFSANARLFITAERRR